MEKNVQLCGIDAQKCKPDCSFTSFCEMWWLTALEKKSSSIACKCKCTYYHRGMGGKKNTCISCSLLPLRFHFRDKPLWPTLSRSIASLKYFAIPHESETTLDVFPYLHTNADFCWLCTPVSCHANPVQLIALLKLCLERLWNKLTDASCSAYLHCQIIKDNTVCFIFKIVPVVHITAKTRKRSQW